MSDSFQNIYEERPWGSYEVLHAEEENGFQVKRVELNPHARLSLQRHRRRDEIWTITSGLGVATLDETEIPVRAGVVVHVPRGMRHRMTNTGDRPLVLIEVQTGDYFGEDDIERFEDDYGRI